MQKIRIDYDGQRTLGLEKGIFEFKILVTRLTWGYLCCIKFADIWSSAYLNPTTPKVSHTVQMDFNIGSMMVKNIEIMANGATLAN